MLRGLYILILCLMTSSASGAQPVVLVMGDSLSAGYGLNAGESWVSLLQHRLDKEGYGYRVVNASISGDTSRGGKARIPRALKTHNPDIVIIELGANDGLRGIPIAEMEQNLRFMVEAAQTADARVVLLPMRIPSNYGPAYIQRFEQVYKTLIEKYQLPRPQFILDNVATNSELMQDDEIHPTADAQTLMLDNVWESIQVTLQQQKSVGEKSGG